jgi:uncharacterized protein (TIGR02145 family)
MYLRLNKSSNWNALPSFINNAFGLIEANDKLYIVGSTGAIYEVNLNYPYGTTLIQLTGLINVAGASQTPGCCNVNLIPQSITTTTTSSSSTTSTTTSSTSSTTSTTTTLAPSGFNTIYTTFESLTPLTTTTSSSSTTTTTTTIAPSTTTTTTTTVPLVTICSQIWTLENLDVETYRNGDVIPQVTDPIAWENLTTGAWCYYNNDSANGPIYGKLYNWYAVTDPRGLAPIGYHVPTDAEFETLIVTCLGGETVAGGKMKSTGTTLWNSPNTDATNSSGFTGLPAGSRNYDGQFLSINDSAVWWTSTPNVPPGNPLTARSKYVVSNFGFAYNLNTTKTTGLSVRLIKD